MAVIQKNFYIKILPPGENKKTKKTKETHTNTYTIKAVPD